jgi:hypothetical protein
MRASIWHLPPVRSENYAPVGSWLSLILSEGGSVSGRTGGAAFDPVVGPRAGFLCVLVLLQQEKRDQHSEHDQGHKSDRYDLYGSTHSSQSRTRSTRSGWLSLRLTYRRDPLPLDAVDQRVED